MDKWSKMAQAPHTTTLSVTPIAIPTLGPGPGPDDGVDDAEPGTEEALRLNVASVHNSVEVMRTVGEAEHTGY